MAVIEVCAECGRSRLETQFSRDHNGLCDDCAVQIIRGLETASDSEPCADVEDVKESDVHQQSLETDGV